MKRCLALLSIVLIAMAIVSCDHPSNTHFTTGLKVFKDFDSARRFDTTSVNAAMIYRPVKIDLFYPSQQQPTGPALTYGDILDMYEQRMDYNITIDSCRKVSLQLAKMIGDYLKIDSAGKLLQYKTGIFKDLELPEKKYPLVIYASGMNGSSWENPALFDTLVHHGYVVASISSVGLFPGYMSGAADMQEQVMDILYTIQKMKAEKYIDPDKIGLLSWSLGGTAIVRTAMLSKDVKCLLSMDGTEIHYFGFDTAWDSEYKQIMKIPPFDPANISVPYMYLSSEHPKQVDSIYVFQNHVRSEARYFVKFNGAVHENFSFLPSLAKAVDPKLANLDSGRHEIIARLALTFLNQYLNRSSSESTNEYVSQLISGRPGFLSNKLPKK